MSVSKYQTGDIIAFLGKRWWVKAYTTDNRRYLLVPIVSASFYVTDGRTKSFPQSKVEAEGASWKTEEVAAPPKLKSKLTKKERQQRYRGERDAT